MSDFLFAAKALAVTIALVFLMQIKVGDTTVEKYSMSVIQNSVVTSHLQAIAQSAVKIMSVTFYKVRALFDTNVERVLNKNKVDEPGSRLSRFSFSRSEAVRREQERRERERAEEIETETSEME